VTVHVISVGKSLTDCMETPDQCRALKGKPDLAEQIRTASPHRLVEEFGKKTGHDASAWLAKALAPEDDPNRDARTADRVTGICAAISPRLWPGGISAEFDTFDRASGSGRLLNRKDIALLVSSDTAEGLVAGVWNATALTGGDLARVRYLADPDDSPTGLRGRAAVVRVPFLDAGDEAGFRQAMRGLGHLGRNLLAHGGIDAREPFRFYLSGGFKAAIPYLIGLAEGIRSLDPDRDVAAYVLHDTTRAGAIGLPLRWLIKEKVTGELTGFGTDGTRRDSPPAPRFLEGYAYDKDGRTWRLTAFGAGLRALFGLDPEPLVR